MIKKFFLLLIKGYKKGISPLLGNHCRFYPTCSMYMYEAIEKHGIFKGIGLGLRRLLRCHPFHPGGYDPVPGSEGNHSNDISEKCHSHHHTDQHSAHQPYIQNNQNNQSNQINQINQNTQNNKEAVYKKKKTIIKNHQAIMKVSNEVK